MSQARVTDFFSRKKKGTGGPAKVPPPRSSTVGGRDSSPCSSSVHEEFVRVIDEAAGLNNGESAISNAADAEAPAYQRYHTLGQAAPPGLSLPYHYKVLAEMFRSMDTVIAMLYNRCETATFAKIKRGVQDMMHKRFEESHIGQIKTVFPEAYTFRQEKNIPTFNSSIKKGSYQLTVEPIITSELNEARPVLSASRLLERRRIFHQNLVSMVKQHHKVFLSSLDPPVLVPEDKLTRWHPRFNVDTVAPVHTSSLPQVPQTEKLATAQEVLDKARSLLTPKMEKALVGLALKTEDKAADKEPTSVKNPAVPQASAVPAAQVPHALKGVSQSLLDRIRAKEAQKLQAAMTRNSNQEERLLMMSRLGELARILRNVFVAEKKPSLVMEVACNRMVASYRSALSTGEMEKHIRLLAEVTGDWLTIHPVRKDLYLKLNKSVELSTVVDKLNSRLREEERL
uniref:Chromatin licensing and DNA replication factor 1 n=1 Tax=Amphilophus citrinellus TaxID=61819 RepID=A0A3Q0S7L5_AMPCI